MEESFGPWSALNTDYFEPQLVLYLMLLQPLSSLIVASIQLVTLRDRGEV